MSPFKIAVLVATLLWLAALAYGTHSTYQRMMSQAEPVANNPGTYRIKTPPQQPTEAAGPASSPETQTVTQTSIVTNAFLSALAYTAPLWLFTIALLATIRFANRETK